jgi:Ca2+-dependent lipid-binding protein
VSGNISLRLENPIVRRLVLMSATGLRGCDRTRSVQGNRQRTSDPYAIVFWNDREVGQTAVEKETLNPTWDADFVLTIDPVDGEGTLKIEVFDHDVGSGADFLGQVECVVGYSGYGGPGVVMDRRAFALQPRPTNPSDRVPGSIAFRVEDPDGQIDAVMANPGRPMTPRGLLEVTVLEAKNLKKMDMVGKNDPYAVVTVDGETRQTSTVESGGSHPSWGQDGSGEMLVFEVGSATSIELACYDEDRGSADDLIGAVILDLDHAPDEDWAMDEWWELTDKKKKSTGSIHLHVSWSNPRERPGSIL